MLKYKGIIVYLLIVIIGFIYALWNLIPHVKDLYSIEEDIKAKTLVAADLDRKLQDLKNSEIDKLSVSQMVKNIYKPSIGGADLESSFAVVFDDIIEMAKYNGIRIYSLEYIYNPPEDEFVKQASASYNVCELKMQLVSDYTDFEGFLKELFKYPYLINIEKVELTPYLKNKKILIINLNLKLYSEK